MDFIYCLISGICSPSEMSQLFALVQGNEKNSLHRWPTLTYALWLERELKDAIALPRFPLDPACLFNALPQHLSPSQREGGHRASAPDLKDV